MIQIHDVRVDALEDGIETRHNFDVVVSEYLVEIAQHLKHAHLLTNK